MSEAQKVRLYSGIYACPSCGIEYELERVPEEHVTCDDCDEELEVCEEPEEEE